MVPGSSIVIITSTEAYRGSYGASAYAATKAAIHNLVRTLANNLGQRGIRINALPAGWIGGEMDTDEVFNKSRSLTPLGRLGTDEEIAKDSGESRATVQRYIRLTNLIPEFLDKMDNGEIALSVGVELSFLDEQSQYDVLEQCEINDCTPSYSQAFRMHKAYVKGCSTVLLFRIL